MLWKWKVHGKLKAWNLIISKDRVQNQKETDSIPSSHQSCSPSIWSSIILILHHFDPTTAATAAPAAPAAAIADEWNVKDRPAAAEILEMVFSRSEMALRFLCTQILLPLWSCALKFCPPLQLLHSNSMPPPFSTAPPAINNDHSLIQIKPWYVLTVYSWPC